MARWPWCPVSVRLHIIHRPDEDDITGDADDPAHAWRMEAMDEVEQITDVVKELCDLLGYQEEQEQAA